jgi:hypothetical protein
MKNKRKKLHLNRETIRALRAPSSAQRSAGGNTLSMMVCSVFSPIPTIKFCEPTTWRGCEPSVAPDVCSFH